MSGVKGPPTKNLRLLHKAINETPREAAIETARAGAPEITGYAKASHAGGVDVFGNARPLGKRGNALSLWQLGNARADLLFVAGGTRMVASMAQKYTKYLIGKYFILPCGNQALPTKWLRGLDRIARERCDEAWEAARKKVGL